MSTPIGKRNQEAGGFQYFYPMPGVQQQEPYLFSSREIASLFLDRLVQVDLYRPTTLPSECCPVLLVNDGQDLRKMPITEILSSLFDEEPIRPFLLVAIHAGKNRKLEYGTAGEPDYLGRGNRADRYDRFILQELIPFIHANFPQTATGMVSLAGFSLGGLTAMDMAWRHPEVFQSVGVFSGSFWWRSLAQEDPLYSDAKHRIMHQRVRMGEVRMHQRFFFQCGALDEQLDRNRNGIIDSIDDTLDLIEELKAKGISRATNMYYLELADGKHDVETWSRALPFFLRWNFGQ